jgi:hypothetical protein
MAREEKNWRELCGAIAAEEDSEKLAALAQRLLAVLEHRMSDDSRLATEDDASLATDELGSPRSNRSPGVAKSD